MHLVRSSIMHSFQNRGGERKKIARAQEWEGGKYGTGRKALAFLNSASWFQDRVAGSLLIQFGGFQVTAELHSRRSYPPALVLANISDPFLFRC